MSIFPRLRVFDGIGHGFLGEQQQMPGDEFRQLAFLAMDGDAGLHRVAGGEAGGDIAQDLGQIPAVE